LLFNIKRSNLPDAQETRAGNAIAFVNINNPPINVPSSVSRRKETRRLADARSRLDASISPRMTRYFYSIPSARLSFPLHAASHRPPILGGSLVFVSACKHFLPTPLTMTVRSSWTPEKGGSRVLKQSPLFSSFLPRSVPNYVCASGSLFFF